MSINDIEIRHFHLFCGLGGGAKGFNRGEARVGSLRASYRCIGGIDVDPASIADFGRAAGVPGTCVDLFDREQYVDFHGREPGPDWREAMPDDIRRAGGNERPHIVFLSAPCKGFSGLLAEKQSKTAKYQALNRLTIRGVWLMLEAWKDDLPELIVFENVPRIATRGRPLLDAIIALLRSYGFHVAETTHDCGVLGGLAQSRKRFLLVARNAEKVPNFLYEPPHRPLRGVGDVIGRLPIPGPVPVLPMHRMPSLQWKTWVRLAFVEAGSDWRSLNRLAIADGVLRDFGIMPEETWHSGALGVKRWAEPSATVTSRSGPTNGAYAVGGWQDPAATITSQRSPGQGRFSVADPRIDGHEKSVQMGVGRWDQPAAVVKGDVSVGTGRYAVADPRIAGARFNNLFRIVAFDETAPAVAGPGGAGGGMAVADPRPSPRDDYKQTKYRVTSFDEATGAVIAASTTGNGAFAVADPRWRAEADRYVTEGHYGVADWREPTGSVTASAKHDSGKWSVADPRVGDETGDEYSSKYSLPAPADRLVAMIRALDGTWHRPFTTLELAALQGLVEPEETLELEGLSDSAWRERIGNAVPPPAAQAIASVMGRTLLLAWSGETFMLSSDPIWVRPIAVATQVGGLA